MREWFDGPGKGIGRAEGRGGAGRGGGLWWFFVVRRILGLDVWMNI